MYCKPLLTALTLAASALAAPTTTGYALVKNNKPFSLWVTSVSSTIGPTTELLPGAYWTEPFYSDPKTGIAIKITAGKDDLYTAKPVLTFGYTLNDAENAIYYDLNSVYGLAKFVTESKVTVTGTKGKNVSEIVWDKVTSVPPQNTKAYKGDTDLYLTIGA